MRLANNRRGDALRRWTTREPVTSIYMDADTATREVECDSVEVLHIGLAPDVFLEMALIQGGTFSMGSHEPDTFADERPRHLVRVRSFYISRMTITQAQWKAVMRKLPPCRSKGIEMPVDRVSFTECERFLRTAGRLTGEPLRFPSESEWEYACRAGSHSLFSFGDMVTTDVCNYVGTHRFRNGPTGEYRHGPVRGGTFPPNGFGLFDMHGNLWEWCADSWHDDYSGAPLDGEPWVRGGTDERVLRGGSWHDPPNLCRSACRLKLAPSEGEDYVGLRVALSLSPERYHVGTVDSKPS